MQKISFANWFRKTRKKKRQTQIHTAEALKIRASTVSRWEKGAEPRAVYIRRICKWGPIGLEQLLKMIERTA